MGNGLDVTAIVGLLVGLCGFLAAFILRSFDRRLTDVEDLADETSKAVIRIEAREALHSRDDEP